MRKIFIIFFISPLLLLLLYIFVGIWQYPDLLPTSYSFRSINFFIRNSNKILLSTLSSLTYSLFVVLLSFLLTILPASFLGTNNFKGKSLLEAILLSPVLIPSITFSMGIHWILIKIGLSNTFFGVVLVLTMFSYPYMLRSLTTGFMLYPRDLDVCAKNLGANLFFRIRKIHIPLLLPSIISGGTIVFLSSFSSYFILFLIGGGRVLSLTGYLFPFLKSEDLNISSLLSIIFLIVPLLLFVLIEILFRRIKYEKKL